jgi:hypothetical protein
VAELIINYGRYSRRRVLWRWEKVDEVAVCRRLRIIVKKAVLEETAIRSEMHNDKTLTNPLQLVINENEPEKPEAMERISKVFGLGMNAATRWDRNLYYVTWTCLKQLSQESG